MRTLIFGLIGAILVASAAAADSPRQTLKFNDDWKFKLGDTTEASHTDFKDADWRTVRVPHDYSIEGPPGADPTTMEGPFDRKSPAGAGGGYLNAPIAWYRKTFTVPASAKGQRSGHRVRRRVHEFRHLSQRQTAGEPSLRLHTDLIRSDRRFEIGRPERAGRALQRAATLPALVFRRGDLSPCVVGDYQSRSYRSLGNISDDGEKRAITNSN